TIRQAASTGSAASEATASAAVPNEQMQALQNSLQQSQNAMAALEASLKQAQADRDGLSEQLRVSDQRSQELQARLSFLEDQAREQAERKAEQGNSVSAEVAALKRALADKEAELEIVRGSRAAS